MKSPQKQPAATKQFENISLLLGGPQVLRHPPATRLDAHEMLVKGLPGRALVYLVTNLITLSQAEVLSTGIGVSVRTYQRTKKHPNRALTTEQSGKTWRFAEILAKATTVFGSQLEAERWLEEPAIGLDQRKPIDLLSTPAGAELVERFLNRLEHGVYM